MAFSHLDFLWSPAKNELVKIVLTATDAGGPAVNMKIEPSLVFCPAVADSNCYMVSFELIKKTLFRSDSSTYKVLLFMRAEASFAASA